MKVLLVSHSASLIGGSERSLLELAAYLQAQPELDVTVAVPAEGPLSAALDQRGVPAVAFPYSWAVTAPAELGDLASSFAALGQIRAHLEHDRPDVVMTNTTVIPWFAFLAYQLGVPHAWFLREDVTADISIDFYPDRAQTLDLIDRYSDRLFANSEYIRGRYAEALGRDDIEVVHPTIDRRILDLGARSSRRASTAKTRIIVYGPIYRAKNQLELLEAARILHARRSDFNVTVMGAVASPDYFRELRRFVRESRLGSVVRFVAHRDDPYPTVLTHDIVVVPSRAEPFGRTSVEAMLLGRPVIASDAGGNIETVGGAHGVGLLYRAGDAGALADGIEQLIDDPAERQVMGNRARAYASRRFMTTDGMARAAQVLRELATLKQPAGGSWLYVEAEAQLERQVAELGRMVEQRGDQIARLELELTAAADERARLGADAARLRSDLADARALIELYETSTSWRVTAPLRAVGRAAKRIATR